MNARVVLAGLELLDRQIVDRDGRLAGKVDDLELTVDEVSDDLRVTAILSGHGSLLRRLGARRLADWMEQNLHAEHGEHSRIPFDRVTEIGSAIRVGLRHDELATFDTERWIRDHVTSHIPGNRNEPAS